MVAVVENVSKREVRYTVESDEWAIDPLLDWSNVELHQYRVPYLSQPRESDDQLARVFAHVYDRGGVDAEHAVKVARRYAQFVGDERFIGCYEWIGYSQGDWGEYLLIADSKDEADQVAAELAAYWRGDVFTVTREVLRHCSSCKQPEVIKSDSIGGIISDDENEALEVGIDALEPQHADYPHKPGTLPGCACCEVHCYCSIAGGSCAWIGHDFEGDE